MDGATSECLKSYFTFGRQRTIFARHVERLHGQEQDKFEAGFEVFFRQPELELH